MKLLLIFSVLAFFLILLYWRLRPYLIMARKMLSVVRAARQMGTNDGREPLRQAGKTVEKLARCQNCGTWTPAARAITVRSSNAVFCSQTCAENAGAKIHHRKSASGRS